MPMSAFCRQHWIIAFSLTAYVTASVDQQVARAPSVSPLLTPAQARFLSEAQEGAAEASHDVEAQLLEAFNSPSFRLELLSQGQGALSLTLKSASELLADLKDALHSLEFLFSFGLDEASAKMHPGQPHWSLKSIDKHGYIPTLWELKVDGKSGAIPESQWKLVDAEETGLYRQPAFAKEADPNRTEAAQRPSYVSGNLARFDAGIWEFGVYAPVYRRSVLKERAVVAGVDGGGWETVCNQSASTINPIYRHLKPFLKCDAIRSGGKSKVVFGTMDHLLHTFYANVKIFSPFGATLARRMYQFLVPGASLHPLENNMYLEAVFFGPARMQDMKLFVASFPDVFGTPEADELREFCKRHRLPLAWAFGGGKVREELDEKHKLMWLPYEPLVEWPVYGERLLDPATWAFVDAKAPFADAVKWASVDVEAKLARKGVTKGLDASLFSSWWTSLKAAGGRIRQLRGKDCSANIDLCFGTSGDSQMTGQCLCRKMTETAIEQETVLV